MKDSDGGIIRQAFLNGYKIKYLLLKIGLNSTEDLVLFTNPWQCESLLQNLNSLKMLRLNSKKMNSVKPKS